MKIFRLLLFVIGLFVSIPLKATIASGTCGFRSDVRWVLNDDYTLVIYGIGDMYDYIDSDGDYVDVPWLHYSDRITKVIIHDGVTSIGEASFADCTNMTSISIPNSVKSIGYAAFMNCERIEIAEFGSIESVCSISFGGWEANPLDHSKKLYVNGKEITDLIIPNSVTRIGNNAFYGCSGLISVTIPNSVTSIGERAFYGCSGLTSVVIGNSVTNIYQETFYKCSSLNSVTIGNSVTSIGEHVFYGCSSLTSVTIPNSVKDIWTGAFSECSKLNKAEFNSIESLCSIHFNSMESNPLYYAKNLYVNGKEIKDLIIPNSVTKINDITFCGCSGLNSVTIPSSVTGIGRSAFYGCSNLASINIGSSVKSIGSAAFKGCDNLKKANFSTVESLFNIDFNNQDNYSNPLYLTKSLYINNIEIKDLVIPVSVKNIKNRLFYGCSGLTSVTIPNSVTSIGSYSFYGCSGITSVTIPNSVTSIGSDAFAGCSGLTSVTVPNSVTSIGGDAFWGCNNLKKAKFASVESLCAVSFGNSFSNPLYYTKNLCINNEEIKDLVIPSTVTSISPYAFNSCCNLSSVTIPSSVTSIGSYAFNYLGMMILEGETPASAGSLGEYITIFVPDNALDLYKSATGWKNMNSRIFAKNRSLKDVINYAADEKLKLAETIGIGNEQNVVSLKIHGTLNGYDLMVIRNKMKNLRILDLSDASIVADEGYEYYPGCKITDNVLGNHVFYDMENLLSIVMPKDITSIGECAFQRCLGLVSVSGIPESCTSIGSYAFANCADLRKIILPNSVTQIDYGAFYMCKSLNEIILSNSITTIGEEVFEYCSSLSEIIIPNSVMSIGSNSFRNCSGLKKIKFSENLKTIGSSAFHSCSSLVELKLPSSLEYIGGNAFWGCTGLSAIHLPSMLTSISYGAFENCGKKDVYVYTLSPISISMDTFNFDGVLHAPQEPYSVFFDYYTDTQWSQFANVVPFEAKYSSWYMGEDQDITLNDGETIPNEDEEQAEGEMAPGSGLNYQDGAYQWLDKLNLKWKEGHAPSLIDNSSVFVDELIFTLDVKAGKWYFFCFPFDIELDKAKFNGKFVWRYYDGDERASNGQGGWKNIGGNKLNKFQGYIFQTNKSGEIELTINDPIFTGGDKDVNVENHASVNNQDAGWNFIGNPNLSHYDLSCFIENFNCPITVWDPVNNTYNAIVPGDDDYTFSPFEAFFVQKPAGTNAMTFESENRETGNQAKATQNAKAMSRMAKAINPERLIVNLTISNGEMEDKTRVVFNDKKTLFYDEGCDAGKFLSTENVPQIYTIDGKNVKYAINERPNSGNIVKVGYKASAEGSYTISAKRMDCLMAIKDNKTGITHKFSDGDYEFTSDAGTFDDRFTLMLSAEVTGIKSLQTAGIVLESGSGYIALGGLNGKSASVYAANGMKVATITDNGRTDIAAGTYIVKVGDCSSKVVVK